MPRLSRGGTWIQKDKASGTADRGALGLTPPVGKFAIFGGRPETGGWPRQIREKSRMMKNKKIGVKKWPKKKRIYLESLKEQLRKKQADISVFNDLLDDYMTLYDVKKKLKTDIKKRGVTYETMSASGKAKIVKQNQSVKDLVAVNKQMLMILDKLELTTKETIKGDDDEEL